MSKLIMEGLKTSDAEKPIEIIPMVKKLNHSNSLAETDRQEECEIISPPTTDPSSPTEEIHKKIPEPSKNPETFKNFFLRKKKFFLFIILMILTVTGLSVYFSTFFNKKSHGYKPASKSEVIYARSTSSNSKTLRNLLSEETIDATFIVLESQDHLSTFAVIPEILPFKKLRNLRKPEQKKSENDEKIPEGQKNGFFAVFIVQVDTSKEEILSLKHPPGADEMMVNSIKSLTQAWLINSQKEKKIRSSKKYSSLENTEKIGKYFFDTKVEVDNDHEDYDIVTSSYTRPRASERKLEESQHSLGIDRLEIKKTSFVNKKTGYIDKTKITGQAVFDLISFYENSDKKKKVKLDIDSETAFEKADVALDDEDIKDLKEKIENNFDFTEFDLDANQSRAPKDESEKVPSIHGRSLLISESLNIKLFEIFGENIRIKLNLEESGSDLLASTLLVLGDDILTLNLGSHNFGSGVLKKIRQMITLKNFLEVVIQKILNEFNSNANSTIPEFQKQALLKSAEILIFLDGLDKKVKENFENFKNKSNGYVKEVETKVSEFKIKAENEYKQNPNLKNSTFELISKGVYNWTQFFIDNNLLDTKKIVEDCLITSLSEYQANLQNLKKSIQDFKSNYSTLFTDFKNSVQNSTDSMLNSTKDIWNQPTSETLDSDSKLFNFSVFTLQASQIKDLISKLKDVNKTLSQSLIQISQNITSKISSIFNSTFWSSSLNQSLILFKSIETTYKVRLNSNDSIPFTLNYTSKVFVTELNSLNTAVKDISPFSKLTSDLSLKAVPSLVSIEDFKDDFINLLGKTKTVTTNLFSLDKKYKLSLPSIPLPIGIISFNLKVEAEVEVDLVAFLSYSKNSFNFIPSAELELEAEADWNFVLGKAGADADVEAKAKLPVEPGFNFETTTFYIEGNFSLKVSGDAGVYFRWLTGVKLGKKCWDVGLFDICIPWLYANYGSKNYIFSDDFDEKIEATVIPYKTLKLGR